MIRIAIAIAAMLTMVPSPVAAQTPAITPPDAPARQADPYESLYDAILSAMEIDTLAEGTAAGIRTEYATIPAFIAIEKKHPGFIDEYVGAMRPALAQNSASLRERYRPRYIELFRSELTPGEAADIAQFYRTPVARKIVTHTVDNYRPTQTLKGIMDKPGASETEVGADISTASRKTVGSMTSDELVELGQMAREKPALLKLGRLSRQMTALRTEMENEPMDPAVEADMVAALIEVMRKYGVVK